LENRSAFILELRLAISDEIRGWLYGWLGKAKLGTPSYSFTPLANCGEKTRQHHVELGISVNKKDAATNAARDFAYFLTRQKLLDPTELPKLTASMLEAPNPDSFGRDSALENGILLNKTEGNSCTTTDVSVDMQFIPSSRIKTEHQQQKAEEIALATFSARTEGSTKNTAEATYALSLMRQLFHNQLLADISFIVNDELSKEIAHYLALVGVDEVQPSPETSASNPVSLLITQKLNQFEPSQAISDGFVSWGPALENWNDHGSH
uniref:DRBM domain-containing protein n=1 Tax=Wuchereria bancrofti TaxID=6293 RepID=A0AAF5RU05_WUCBA